nr:putative F-box_LRR-repeat protein [Moumouvirus Monve]
MFDITLIEFDHCTSHEINYCEIVRNSSQNITNLGLAYLHNVSSLKLKKCNNITDEGLIHLSIYNLELKYCNNIKGKFLEHLKNANIKIFGNNIKREYSKNIPNIKFVRKNILQHDSI